MSYRKLRVWQNAFEANLIIYKKIKCNRNVDRALLDQTRRASVSVILNIAEGLSRESQREKIRFLDIAYASANETLSALLIIERISENPIPEMLLMQNQYEIICKQLYLFKQRLKSSIV